jgi:phosphoribosylformylglycinamidine cyclo-ligase
MKITYSESGVDIDKKDRITKELIKKIRFARKGFGIPTNLDGHFTSLIDFGRHSLSLCTDGVGTKIMIANEMRKWDTVGIDCVAMNVNDMICVGAEPIAFVDYIAMEKPDEEITRQIGIGLSKGAELSNISIVGGETAILPGVINGLDLAGTCLGYVEKGREITGKRIKAGDCIIGLKSSGLHSNGYTLVRRVFKEIGYTYNDKIKGYNKKLGDVLLEPTRIYVKEILEAIKKFEIRGLANITGSGLWNISRLKNNVEFRISDPIEPQPIFQLLQELNKISDYEMYQTFNMGMGFCIIVDKKECDSVLSFFKNKVEARCVGEVVKGKGVSVPQLKIKYK